MDNPIYFEIEVIENDSEIHFDFTVNQQIDFSFETIPTYFEIDVEDYDNEIEFEFETEATVDFGFDTQVNVTTTNIPVYEGEYEFTPTEETQVVLIKNMKATDNIVVNPIPQNYGRIEWNGVYLTVR